MMRRRRLRRLGLLIGALFLLGPGGIAVAATPAADTAPQVHVQGNRLVDQDGHTVLLHGVNRSGGEFACVQGWGFWDGPMDQASVDAIKSWNVDVVRIPLNEACWNGESYVNPTYAGENYRNAVRDYVDLLNRNGLLAILEIHWSDGLYTGPSTGCDSPQATCQKPMPDAAQAIPFWRSVAGMFKHDRSVIFDLFNEPYPDRALPTAEAAWNCWRDGGRACSAGISYPVAGMQTLLDTVRDAGAHNVVMMGGLAYSNDLTGWLRHMPRDREHNVVASWHSYNFNACSTESCWNCSGAFPWSRARSARTTAPIRTSHRCCNGSTGTGPVTWRGPGIPGTAPAARH